MHSKRSSLAAIIAAFAMVAAAVVAAPAAHALDAQNTDNPTFTYLGMEYTITDGENRHVTLSGVDTEADTHVLTDEVDLADTDEQYTVTDVQGNALEGIQGTLRMDSAAAAIASKALDGANLDGVDSIDLLVCGDVTINQTGFTAGEESLTLPDGRIFDHAATEAFEGTITNSTGTDVPLLVLDNGTAVNAENPITIANGGTFDTSLLGTTLEPDFTVRYRIDGTGKWQEATVTSDNFYSDNEFIVFLPTGTARDATVEFSLAELPGVKAGYITTSWENNSATFTLRTGNIGDDTLKISSTITGASTDYRFRASVTAPSSIVYIDGAYHERPFTSEDGSVRLEYDNDGKPIITLDNADITEIDSDYTYEYHSVAIYSYEDLTIRLKGESTLDVESDGLTATAIRTDGKLTIIGEDDASGTPAKLSVSFNHVAPESEDSQGGFLMANSIDVRNADLDLTLESDTTTQPIWWLASLEDVNIADSSLTLTAPTDGGAYIGVQGDTDVTLSDVDMTTRGKMNIAIIGTNITVSGQSHLDLECADNREPAAIGASKKVYFNLQGTGSVYVRGNPDTEAPSPYAVLSRNIELADGTEVTDPEQATTVPVITSQTDGSEFFSLADKDGKAVSTVTIKAKASAQPSGGEQLPATGSGTATIAAGMLVLAALGIGLALLTRRGIGTRR
ncbi:hypothetical protein [Bifidobacterium lemurum]|nr:hypothetical protein [Bifidobacterium lemurum]